MKKIILFVFLMFSLILTGCASGADDTLKNIIDDVKIQENVLTSQKLNIKVTIPENTKWFDSEQIKEQIAPTMEMSDYEKSQSKGAFIAMCSGIYDSGEFSVSIYAVKTNENIEKFAESLTDKKVYSNVELNSTQLQDKKIGQKVYKYNQQKMKYAGEEKDGISDYGKFEIVNDMYYLKIDNYIITMVISDSKNKCVKIEALS